MKKVQINLLTKKEDKVVNKIIYFGLHYLRYIIVITQIIVIGVFFYRFKIDQEIIDLKEKVQQKQEIFKITQPLLDEAALINKESTFIQDVLAKQNSFNGQTKTIFSNIPTEMILVNVVVDEKKISVEGISQSSARIKQLTELLKNSKAFKDVQISRVEKSEFGYQFTINITR